MPIFFKNGKKILFIHIPKTGGTYVERLFKHNGFEHDFWMQPKNMHFLGVMHCSPQHLHWAQLRNIFVMRKFDYMFTVVRDPLARFISEYHMRSRKHEVEFEEWAHKILDKHQKNKFVSDNHLRPQVEFVGEGVEVFKLEDGLDAAWLARVQAKLGEDMPALSLPPRAKKQQSPPVQPSRAIIERVQQLYAQDYQRFAYPLKPLDSE